LAELGAFAEIDGASLSKDTLTEADDTLLSEGAGCSP